MGLACYGNRRSLSFAKLYKQCHRVAPAALETQWLPRRWLLLQASAPASRRTRPHGSFCKYLFTFLSPPSPFRLASHKSGNWRRMFRRVSVPTGQANLEQANVKGVTWTVAAAWWCLTNSKACYTWVTVHLTCCSAHKLSIAVRHTMSSWFKLKHFDPDPNVYLHAFRYTDVNYQFGNKSCSEYG